MGILNKKGSYISGKEIIEGMSSMRPRYNGLGAGFACYGIYPEYKDYYALHVMLQDEESLKKVEDFLIENVKIIKEEDIPTREVESNTDAPILRRFFLEVLGEMDPDEFMLDLVMSINTTIDGAFIMSSGKNMGVFKGVGFPSEVAEFYRLDEYKAYIWLGHGRYPTNTPGWWGGAHPFNILGWSVVHNGEISSYETNRKFLGSFGYKCALLTDTEIFAYLFDLLVRKHKLPFKMACTAITPPLWSEIDQLDPDQASILRSIRMVYSSALVNGPFSIIVATNHGMTGMFGLADRLKLRPLITAEYGETTYIASEESAIKSICSDPDKTWAPKAGEPVIAEVTRRFD